MQDNVKHLLENNLQMLEINEQGSVNQRILKMVDVFAKGNKKAFGEKADIQSGVLAGMVGGRMTKPSFDVLQKLLTAYPSVNSDWLLFGLGDMFKPEYNWNFEKFNETMNKIASQSNFKTQSNPVVDSIDNSLQADTPDALKADPKLFNPAVTSDNSCAIDDLKELLNSDDALIHQQSDNIPNGNKAAESREIFVSHHSPANEKNLKLIAAALAQISKRMQELAQQIAEIKEIYSDTTKPDSDL